MCSSKPIITYRLVPFEKAVAFQILDMDEEQRLRGASFTAPNGMRICSNNRPNLRLDIIHVRGQTTSYDLSLQIMDTLASNEARDCYIANIHAALREWADAGGFTGHKKVNTIKEDEYTYRLG